jgi:uncharacterized membrane protein
MLSESATNGFSDAINFTFSGLPSGATSSLQSASSFPISVPIATISSTPPGTYQFTITGTSGSMSSSASATLIVQASIGDFALSLTPQTQTVTAGAMTTFTINVQGMDGFSQPVALSASSTDPQISIAFASVNVTPGNSTALTVTVGAGLAPGNYQINVVGSSGQITHTAMATLQVTPAADFSLSVNPGQLAATRGVKTMITVNIQRTGGFTGNVMVTAPNTKAIKIKITPPSQATVGNGVNFNLKIKKGAAVGTQQLIFTGVDSAGRARTATLTLNIQ